MRSRVFCKRALSRDEDIKVEACVCFARWWSPAEIDAAVLKCFRRLARKERSHHWDENAVARYFPRFLEPVQVKRKRFSQKDRCRPILVGSCCFFKGASFLSFSPIPLRLLLSIFRLSLGWRFTSRYSSTECHGWPLNMLLPRFYETSTKNISDRFRSSKKRNRRALLTRCIALFLQLPDQSCHLFLSLK